jgi:aminoglycoside phosphotransferase (APT) family kinase protein
MEKGEWIGRGRTADIYAWGEDRILKLYKAFMSVQAVEQEFNVTRMAQAAGIPVPAADERIEVDGRPGILFERLSGSSMLQVLGAQPWKVVSMARQLAELHARIHRSILPAGLPTQRRQIERGIQAGASLPADIREAALARLAQLPEGQALCHGDFHPDNIMITARGPVIIDWMTGTRGHPLADVCRTSLVFQTSGLPPTAPLHMRLLLKVMRRTIDASYITRYLQLQPAASRPEIYTWQLPLMAARLCEVEDYPQEKQLILTRIRSLMATPTGRN